MKTKTIPTAKRRTTKVVCAEKAINTTMARIGQRVSKMLDIINQPKYKDENFHQVLKQEKDIFSLLATNEEMSISFCIEYKKKK